MKRLLFICLVMISGFSVANSLGPGTMNYELGDNGTCSFRTGACLPINR